MAKEIEVQVRGNGEVITTISRPKNKFVCYEGAMYTPQKEGDILFIDIYGDLPPPGVSEPLDAEDERIIGWWCQNSKRVAEMFGFRKMFVSPEGIGVIK